MGTRWQQDRLEEEIGGILLMAGEPVLVRDLRHRVSSAPSDFEWVLADMYASAKLVVENGAVYLDPTWLKVARKRLISAAWSLAA